MHIPPWVDNSDKALSTVPGSLETLKLLLVIYTIINNNIIKCCCHYQSNGPTSKTQPRPPKAQPIFCQKQKHLRGSEEPPSPLNPSEMKLREILPQIQSWAQLALLFALTVASGTHGQDRQLAEGSENILEPPVTCVTGMGTVASPRTQPPPQGQQLS